MYIMYESYRTTVLGVTNTHAQKRKNLADDGKNGFSYQIAQVNYCISGFPEIGVLQKIIHVDGIFHHKPSI